MKQLKTIGLLALAVTAMTAATATASAAKLTSPTGTEYGKGKTIKATAAAIKLTGGFVTIECATSTIEGTITASGGSAVESSISTLAFNTCNFTTTVKKAGTLSLTPIGAGNGVNGTARSSGAEVEIATSLGTCVFTTSSTVFAILTGGKTASDDVESTLPRTAGNFLCGSSGTLETVYSFVTPDELWFDS